MAIQMLILARVNGYYSPYAPRTIMEEEDRANYDEIFSLAEVDFFRHRLMTFYPKIDEQCIESAIKSFLKKQKMVNCPCCVHTEKRGYDWIVFRRQQDRKLYRDEKMKMK